ncbi:MAG: hypothetical protein AAB211_03485 [Pseudomonadota bacterium]
MRGDVHQHVDAVQRGADFVHRHAQMAAFFGKAPGGLDHDPGGGAVVGVNLVVRGRKNQIGVGVENCFARGGDGALVAGDATVGFAPVFYRVDAEHFGGGTSLGLARGAADFAVFAEVARGHDDRVRRNPCGVTGCEQASTPERLIVGMRREDQRRCAFDQRHGLVGSQSGFHGRTQLILRMMIDSSTSPMKSRNMVSRSSLK